MVNEPSVFEPLKFYCNVIHWEKILPYRSRPIVGIVSSSQEANKMSQKLSPFEKMGKDTWFIHNYTRNPRIMFIINNK